MFGDDTPNPAIDPNPYDPSRPLNDPARFYGREDIFAFIRQQLYAERRARAVALIGRRGVGKTSILFQLPQHLDARTLTAYIDLSHVAFDEPGGLLIAMADAGRAALDAAGISTYRLPPTPDNLPPAELEQWFAATYLDITLSALRRARRLTFLFDETSCLFDALNRELVRSDLPDWIASLLAQDDRLKMLFALDLADEPYISHFAPLADPLLHCRVSNLTEVDAEALTVKPSEPFYTVNADAVRAIYELTGGFPYALHVVNRLVFERSEARNHQEAITVGDMHAILPAALADADPVFRAEWGASPLNERRVLVALTNMSEANGGRPVARDDMRTWLIRESETSLDDTLLAAALRRLEYEDTIRAYPGLGYSFTVPLQQQWLLIHGELPPVVPVQAPMLANSAIHQATRWRMVGIATIAAIVILGGALALFVGRFALGASGLNDAINTPTVTLGVNLQATRNAQDVILTQAAIPTVTPTATASNTSTDTATPTPTNTFTATSTATPSSTWTATPSQTATVTNSSTFTSTSTSSATSSATFTGTPTPIPSNTPTPYPTNSPTLTPSNTPSNTSTNTPTDTATATPTSTPSDTSTATPSSTPTNTPTATLPVTAQILPTRILPTGKAS